MDDDEKTEPSDVTALDTQIPLPLAKNLAEEIARGEALLVRLDGLSRDLHARMFVLKDQTVQVLDEAHEPIVQREERGRLQPESFQYVHRFVEARGEAIAQGIAQARALKAAQKTG